MREKKEYDNFKLNKIFCKIHSDHEVLFICPEENLLFCSKCVLDKDIKKKEYILFDS
jgi:hypothetical protein